MRVRSAASLGALALVIALTTFGGCGGGEEDPAKPLAMRRLASSVEGQSAAFLDRDGTALHRSLARFLGGEISTEVAKGSTQCRPGSQTASIANPKKYPFACIVEGSAEGNGLEVNITLGFVGLDLDDECWRAANERISVTTGAPALLSREKAARPVNQIDACV